MRCLITSSMVVRSLTGSGPLRKAAILAGLAVPMPVAAVLVHAQQATVTPAAAKMVAPGMAAVTRYAEKLDVPRKGKASVAVHAELSSWSTVNRSREITIPPQGFYIATLSNGTAMTVINGEEKLRHAGEMWAVADGQSMTVKIEEKKQENVGLEIFSIRASH
jgi:hypothetical protein